MKSTITHGDMLAVVATKNVYNKRNKSNGDIDVIKKHLPDSREDAVRKDDETIDADNVKRLVDKKYHPEVRKMIRKHNVLWLVDSTT